MRDPPPAAAADESALPGFAGVSAWGVHVLLVGCDATVWCVGTSFSLSLSLLCFVFLLNFFLFF
jgi:hypothetical protein